MDRINGQDRNYIGSGSGVGNNAFASMTLGNQQPHFSASSITSSDYIYTNEIWNYINSFITVTDKPEFTISDISSHWEQFQRSNILNAIMNNNYNADIIDALRAYIEKADIPMLFIDRLISLASVKISLVVKPYGAYRHSNTMIANVRMDKIAPPQTLTEQSAAAMTEMLENDIKRSIDSNNIHVVRGGLETVPNTENIKFNPNIISTCLKEHINYATTLEECGRRTNTKVGEYIQRRVGITKNQLNSLNSLL